MQGQTNKSKNKITDKKFSPTNQFYQKIIIKLAWPLQSLSQNWSQRLNWDIPLHQIPNKNLFKKKKQMEREWEALGLKHAVEVEAAEDWDQNAAIL